MLNLPPIFIAVAVFFAVINVQFASDTFFLYPRSEEVANPRLPAAPPVNEGGTGLSMAVETRFVYELGTFVGLDGSGSVEVLLRDNPRRSLKEALILEGDGLSVVLGFDAASDGRSPFLRVVRGDKIVEQMSLGEPWGESWKSVRVQWSEKDLSVTVDGREPVKLELPQLFSPAQVSLETWHVDELHLEGKGQFHLGWENGYAAKITPASTSNETQARVFGFDTYAVSDNPDQRDFPMLQILNSSEKSKEVQFDFHLRGEITGVDETWTQIVAAPGRAATMQPLTFPKPLASDVYHLAMRTRGLTGEIESEIHFFSVERRDEVPGPPKFGLHDSGNRTFGFWPDALKIDFAHTYAYWGYVVGPSWVRDFNGEYGIDPGTDSKEWSWNRKIDWLLGQNLTPYVSLQSEPLLPWMRERTYPLQKLKKYEWGERGGFPKLDLYRKFVRALAERYKDRIHYYEVENEPNAGGSNGIPPEDYVLIAQAVFEEVRGVDPEAKVFGICGTGNFVPWMAKVFEHGGAKFMDGVAIHTYVTPQLPEQANLPEKMAEVRALIESTGREMPIINSETGTYVAPRERVDEPIPAERLKELIDAGTPTVFLSRGWPNYALTEQVGSISIVRNAIYNFLGGVGRFVFFGWNPNWPRADWMAASPSGSGGGGFGLISVSKDGVRTPGWHTLAISVLTAQLEGALIEGAQPLNETGVRGGVFAKQNGGEVGVIWSSMGSRSILLETTTEEIELVSLFGQRHVFRSPMGDNGRALHSIQITEAPVYVHVKQPGMSLQPSPVRNLRQVNRADGGMALEFSLANRSVNPWKGRVEFTPPEGWKMEPLLVDFNLKPRERSKHSVGVTPPKNTTREIQFGEGSTTLPEGSAFSFPIALEAKPVVPLVTLPDVVNADTFNTLAMPGNRLRLFQPEQVMVGRPPQLTSIQEEQYWKGPAELSGEVKIGRNNTGLYVFIDVTDAYPSPPDPWPGVRGSAVELFFDFRAPNQGLGSGFGPGAYQVLLKPALKDGEKVEIWNAAANHGALEGTSATGGRTQEGYWIMFHIPWASVGRSASDTAPFGFDVGIDGPPAHGGDRKNQLMLFGTAGNNRDTSAYGLVIPR